MAKRTPSALELKSMLPLPSPLGDIVYDYIDCPLILVVNTKSITIPYIKATGLFFIDWGDDKFSDFSFSNEKQVNIRHRYKTDGMYIIQIFGTITDMSFQKMDKLFEVSQWGNTVIYDGGKMFSWCKNLHITAYDTPNLRHAKNLDSMFAGCQHLSGDLNNWDVSRIENMSWMFSSCKYIDIKISNWDVGNVKNMFSIFSESECFNEDLSKWNVGKVENMYQMFMSCVIFNSDLSQWNIGNVTDVGNMFKDCKYFNSDLSLWDTTNITHMSCMLSGCSKFNSDVSKWNVRNVRHMSSAFENCRLFNCDISKWNVENCIWMNNIVDGTQISHIKLIARN